MLTLALSRHSANSCAIQPLDQPEQVANACAMQARTQPQSPAKGVSC